MSIGTGTRLGQYEVQDFVGQGAMGRVYRAYHSQLERTGAVKVMQAMTPDPDTVARFRHEAQAIARLRHPNIVDVYDFGEFQGTPYMIVEYIPGGSLASRLAEGVLDRTTALKYLRGIAAGLDYAHARGVVHRDVKPANVLLTADDTPVLADFGLAKLMEGSSLKSMTGVTTGTPAYMAPEQVTGSKVGPAADRYSLASIAYEMLTGVIPFDGEALMELLYAQVHRYPEPPSARDSSLGPRVDTVIMRGLAKDPAARWDTATRFVDALTSAINPEPALAPTMVMAPQAMIARHLVSPNSVAGTAVEERESRPSHQAVTLAYPSPPPPPAPKRKTHRLRFALIAAGVIVALLIAGVVAYAATHPPVTLSLSSTTVTAGDTLVLTADHLPPNQLGQVELWSAQYTYPFRADSRGHVDVTVSVPADIGAGDHQVKLCWNGSCRMTETLHVLQPLPSPSPSPSPTPTPSVAASPVAHPTPTPPVVSVTSSQIKQHTGTETVGGLHFRAGSNITVTFKQGSSAGRVVGTAVTSSSGYWTVTFTVPSDAVLGYALITACGTANGCYAQTVRVVS